MKRSEVEWMKEEREFYPTKWIFSRFHVKKFVIVWITVIRVRMVFSRENSK